MFAQLRTFALAGLAALALSPAAARAEEEPLPRFEDALCPGVVGLQQESAEAMVWRLRENAEKLGLRMAPNGECTANFIVAFVPDGKAFLTRLRDRSAYLFADMSREERLQLLNDPGPARAMLHVRARSRDGMPITPRDNMSEVPLTSMWMAHSRIYTATRNDIISALVLFDQDVIEGVSVGQLADYATFRALSHRLPDPAAGGEVSILSLFDEGAARPAGLTEFDRAYLGQLYADPANLPASTKLADIAQATGVEAVE